MTLVTSAGGGSEGRGAASKTPKRTLIAKKVKKNLKKMSVENIKTTLKSRILEVSGFSVVPVFTLAGVAVAALPFAPAGRLPPRLGAHPVLPHFLPIV